MTHLDNFLNERLVSSKLLTLAVEQLNPFNVKKCVNKAILRAYKAIANDASTEYVTQMSREDLTEVSVVNCMASQNTIDQARSVLEFRRELKQLYAMRKEGKQIPTLVPPGERVRVNAIEYHERELDRRLNNEYIIQHKVDKKQEPFGVAFLWMRNREIGRLMAIDGNGHSYWCNGSKRQVRRTVVTRNSEEDDARLVELRRRKEKVEATIQKKADATLAAAGFRRYADGRMTITDKYGKAVSVTKAEADRIVAKGASWIDEDELDDIEKLIEELESGERTVTKVIDLPPVASFKAGRGRTKAMPWIYTEHQSKKVVARNDRLRSINNRSSGTINVVSSESDIIESSIWSDREPSFNCYLTRYSTKEKETSMDRLQTSVSWLGASQRDREPKVNPKILLNELAKIVRFNTPWEQEEELKELKEREAENARRLKSNKSPIPIYPYMTDTRSVEKDEEKKLKARFEGRNKPKQYVDWNYNIFFHLNPLTPEVTLFAPRMMRKVTYHLAPFRYSRQEHDKNATKPYFNNGLSYTTCDRYLIPALEEAIKIAMKLSSKDDKAVTSRSFYAYALPSSIKFGAGGVNSTTGRLITASTDNSENGWRKHAIVGPSGQLIDSCKVIVDLFSKYVHPGDVEAYMYATRFPEEAVDHYMNVYKFRVYDVEEGTNLTTINWNERDFFAGILNPAKLNLTQREREEALKQVEMNDDDKRNKMIERLLKSMFFVDHYSNSVREMSKLRNADDIVRRLELYVPEKAQLIPTFLEKFRSIRSGQDLTVSNREARVRDSRSYISNHEVIDEAKQEQQDDDVSFEDMVKQLLIQYFFQGKLTARQRNLLDEFAALDDEDELTFRLQTAFPAKKFVMNEFFTKYSALRD